MKTTALLSLLNKAHLTQLGDRLGLQTSGRDRAALQRALAAKLLRDGGDHQEAVALLVGELSGQHLRRLLDSTEWEGQLTTYTATRLYRVDVGTMRAMLVDLCVAEQERNLRSIDWLAKNKYEIGRSVV